MHWPIISFFITMVLGLLIGFKYIVMGIAIGTVLLVVKKYKGSISFVFALLLITQGTIGYADEKNDERKPKSDLEISEDLQVQMIKEAFEEISENQNNELNSQKGKNESY